MKSRKGIDDDSEVDSDAFSVGKKSCGVYAACWMPKSTKLSKSDALLLGQSLSAKGVPSKKVAVFFFKCGMSVGLCVYLELTCHSAIPTNANLNEFRY